MNTLAFPIDTGLISGNGLTQLLAKFLSGSGVVEADALKVVPLGSPDMKVRIPGSTNSDHLVLKLASGGYLVGWNRENFDLNINPNTTGVTKTDAVVAYFDATAGDIAVPEAPNGLAFMTVRRPLAETALVEDSQIDTEVGHTNWHRLANVTVIHNATAISGGISDTRGRSLIDGAMLKYGSVPTSALVSGSTRVKLAEVVVGVAASSVTISSIPNTARNLALVWAAKNSGSAQVNFQLRFNGDTGANYYGQSINGNNSATSATQEIAVTAPSIGVIPGSAAGTNVFNMGEIHIPLYANTGMEKQFIAHCFRLDGKSSGNIHNDNKSGHWASTSAISSITLIAAANNIVAGSTFTLYGDP